jgi:hypothetical protein
MITSRPLNTALWALAMAAAGLAVSCEQPKQRIGELWKQTRYNRWTGNAPIVDASADTDTDADAAADAGRDAGADAGINAFDLQKPVPRRLIVEYSVNPHRFLRLHTTESDVTGFLDGLNQAVQTSDRQAVAAAVNYPLVVAIGKSHLVVSDRDQFVRDYARIMTAPVVGAIRNATAKNVAIPERAITLGRGMHVLANYTGMSIGNGRIWFDLAEVAPPPVSRYRLLIRMVNATAGR